MIVGRDCVVLGLLVFCGRSGDGHVVFKLTMVVVSVFVVWKACS